MAKSLGSKGGDQEDSDESYFDELDGSTFGESIFLSDVYINNEYLKWAQQTKESFSKNKSHTDTIS